MDNKIYSRHYNSIKHLKSEDERILMMQVLKCPNCSGECFTAKYESAYIYSYKMDTTKINYGTTNTYAAPFLFQDRQPKYSKQYIECDNCNAQYPAEFTLDSNEVDSLSFSSIVDYNKTN